MKERINLVKNWAYARNLIRGSDSKTQFIKLISEYGELCRNYLTGADYADDIGDMLVVAIILCEIQEYNTEQVFNHGLPIHLINKTETSKMLPIIGSQLGRMADHIGKGEDFRTSIHNIIISLNILAVACPCEGNVQLGYTLEECLTLAYHDIKDRKGVMYNGTFIKESDPAYAQAAAAVGQEVH